MGDINNRLGFVLNVIFFSMLTIINRKNSSPGLSAINHLKAIKLQKSQKKFIRKPYAFLIKKKLIFNSQNFRSQIQKRKKKQWKSVLQYVIKYKQHHLFYGINVLDLIIYVCYPSFHFLHNWAHMLLKVGFKNTWICLCLKYML